ncbi:hypothetical protein C8D72_3234 [Kushneria indalinina DSM 14324]|uniref:Uncharacterized protein n=1 Tax=Kushneria indalinina DSM 14324 TaxID=1122140 RepID=A0A3D9DS45_9GAMM|nr:hypothetical protein C8D72_3234 [Kushneria indalinina DSM 14324]
MVQSPLNEPRAKDDVLSASTSQAGNNRAGMAAAVACRHWVQIDFSVPLGSTLITELF